jgi:predicted CoA-binding protein
LSSEPYRDPSEDEIRRLLEGARRIAVVGLSPKPHRDSNRIGRYLLDRGYEVVPVYPREETILGRTVYRRVRDIPGGVDLVDVFRRSEELPGVVEDSLTTETPALWFQLGCVHEGAARRGLQAGALVVMDRCIMVDHIRLFGRGWRISRP